MWHDKEIEQMAAIAADLGASAYAGGWVQLVNWADEPYVPAAVNNFTTACIISQLPRAFIPANSVVLGTRFRIRAWGSYGITATPTIILGLGINPTTSSAGTSVCASASQSPTAGTVNSWWAEFEATITAVGSSGAIFGMGMAWGFNATATTAILIPAATPTSATFNTTQANSLALYATWSSASASNTLTTYGFTVEQLN